MSYLQTMSETKVSKRPSQIDIPAVAAEPKLKPLIPQEQELTADHPRVLDWYKNGCKVEE